MRRYSHRCYQSVVLLAVLSVSPLVSRLIPRGKAQSETKEKPTLKTFGSSLKRLKWDPSKQAAVETVSPEKARDSGAEDVVRITTDLVVCDIMVLDRQGRAVSGLTKDDFAISEDSRPQQVAHFSLGSNANVGRSIVLIMDYSGSLAPYINLSVDAAKTFIEKLNPNDRVAIVTNEVTLLVNFTFDKSRLKKALESMKITALTHKGNSYQFSALLATARELFDEEDIRPIIIFQTDGDQVDFLQPPDPVAVLPYKSIRGQIVQFGLGDVYAAVEKSRATVYTVIPGFRLIGFPEAAAKTRGDGY
jgi:VWFA-related protein